MYRDAVNSLAILSPQACKQATDTILSLDQHWICPNSDFFYTVGAFSAREFFDKDGLVSPDRHDMYESVRTGLESALGAKALYPSEHMGLPGFQILGPSPKQKLLPQDVAEQLEKLEGWSAFHIDAPYMPHTSFWQRFQHADFNNALTFTLSLQLPHSGSGLDVWKNPGDTDAGKKFNAMPASEHAELITDYEFVPYQTGSLTYFTGHVVHRVAGRHRLRIDDRRITLQGHGVKCDGTWYLNN